MLRNIAVSLAVILMLVFSTQSSAATLYIGMEDLRVPGGDRENADLVARFTSPDLRLVNIGCDLGNWLSMLGPNEDGNPYFDHRAYDGAGHNFGHFVTGQGVFAGNPNSPHMNGALYWGVGGGRADTSFMLFSRARVDVEILWESSAYQNQNRVSWFADNPFSFLFPNLLFSGSDGVGATASFNPNGEFGLILKTLENNRFSTLFNGEQFAVARQGEAPVPEPATYLLMGMGLLGLGALKKLRRPNR